MDATNLMKLKLLLSLILICESDEGANRFPDGFIFATSTAAYQIEGAWNVSGKGENIWDHITHTTPDYVEDKSNGDIACDSYNQYKQDIQLIKNVGFSMYRFSISWTRLWPDGLVHGSINPTGVDYYMSVIDELIRNNIEPMVTLYHWDLPQRLQELGGWTNPLMADYFVDYARSVFTIFGDKVKWWITINEPYMITKGYGSRDYAPALNLAGTADYLAGHNLLRAHAKVYRMYQKEFKPFQNGMLSLSNNGMFVEPQSSMDADVAETWNQFSFGWFAHPMLSKEGDYPPAMRRNIDFNSKTEARPTSRLPHFTHQEIQALKGSLDFLAVNHYDSGIVKKGAGPITTSLPSPSWQRDINATLISEGSSGDGFRAHLNWLKKEYNNTPIFITEQGFTENQVKHDLKRIKYFKIYLNNMLKAIHEDNCTIIGYTVWSILDNFEWTQGYTLKFGLYHVDFSDSQRARSPKDSVKLWKAIIKERKIPNNDDYITVNIV